jgi:hypothetical protein
VTRPRRGALAVAAVAVAGCGGSADSEPRAAWVGKPVVVRHPELPGDELATGRVVNRSTEVLRVDAAAVRVLDADGRRVRATVRFAAGYSHGLYPPRDAPRENPRFLRERLGDAATVRPGRSVPLTVAWHRRGRAAAPVRIDLGAASLPLPPGP